MKRIGVCHKIITIYHIACVDAALGALYNGTVHLSFLKNSL
ncbi:MAG: hypothetical protein JWQ02_3507 [Capsulimonas sp.]|jgi:hypothetical protein|nr:hypothetical protein [Capsulimonas sp.]